MRLSISAQFTIKDRPEGYLGLSGEYCNFGKDNPLSVAEMCASVLYKILWFYGMWTRSEKMSEEVDKVIEWLSNLQFRTEGDSDEQEKV